MKVTCKTYITLEELLKYYESNFITYDYPQLLAILTSNGNFNVQNERINLLVTTESVLKLWQYVCSRFINEYILIDDTKSDYKEFTAPFLRKVLNILNGSYDRYNAIYNAFEMQKSKLLDTIKTTQLGSAKFNDTPQGNGDYSDDPHTTNITLTKGETESDNLTPVMRLKEIEDSLNDILFNWSKEFEKIFVEGGNLNE